MGTSFGFAGFIHRSTLVRAARRSCTQGGKIGRARRGAQETQHPCGPWNETLPRLRTGRRHRVETARLTPYRSGRSRHWVESKNPAAPAVKREAEEDWGQRAVTKKGHCIRHPARRIYRKLLELSRV